MLYKNTAFHFRLLACIFELALQVGRGVKSVAVVRIGTAKFINAITYQAMGLVDILHPLIKKLVEAVFPCPRSEVQLRNDYIHPPFFQPFPDIGKRALL